MYSVFAKQKIITNMVGLSVTSTAQIRINELVPLACHCPAAAKRAASSTPVCAHGRVYNKQKEADEK
jgi:hypothetical protein